MQAIAKLYQLEIAYHKGYLSTREYEARKKQFREEAVNGN